MCDSPEIVRSEICGEIGDFVMKGSACEVFYRFRSIYLYFTSSLRYRLMVTVDNPKSLTFVPLE